MTTGGKHDAALGVDCVAVDDEPDHVEKFRNANVRLYEATIWPGRATQFHRHDRDTLYVVLAGGRFRSDEPGRQHPGTKLGRSVSLPTRLHWLVERSVTGWLSMPAGTLLVQPHAAHPLIHRVVADAANTAPIRMFGIELHQLAGSSSAAAPSGPGSTVEHRDPRYTVYRLRLQRGDRTTVTLPTGGVLVTVAGAADVDAEYPVTDEVSWLGPGVRTIRSSTGAALEILLLAF